MLLKVGGSHGTLDVDGTTGQIIRRDISDAYLDIKKFHVDDLGVDIVWDTDKVGWIDILGIGYTRSDGTYEPPLQWDSELDDWKS